MAKIQSAGPRDPRIQVCLWLVCPNSSSEPWAIVDCGVATGMEEEAKVKATCTYGLCRQFSSLLFSFLFFLSHSCDRSFSFWAEGPGEPQGMRSNQDSWGHLVGHCLQVQLFPMKLEILGSNSSWVRGSGQDARLPLRAGAELLPSPTQQPWEAARPPTHGRGWVQAGKGSGAMWDCEPTLNYPSTHWQNLLGWKQAPDISNSAVDPSCLEVVWGEKKMSGSYMSLPEPDLVMPWVRGSACLLPGPYPSSSSLPHL